MTVQKIPPAPKAPKVRPLPGKVIYTDGDSFWTGKRRRRELDRAEFMAMVQAGRVVIVRV